MNLDLLTIAILAAAALLYLALLPGRARGWALLAGSVVAIYWLQPALPIRFSDFILPTTTLGLTLLSWYLTRPGSPQPTRLTRDDRLTLLVIAGLILLLSLNRFLPADYRLTPSRPPSPLLVALALLAGGALIAGLGRLLQKRRQWWVLTGLITLIAALFILLKTEPLATLVSGWWRGLTSQDTSLARAIDLNWLGFSYVAFRLIHTARDRQTGLLPELSLREYVTYVIFFPSFVAGPIDRAERFVGDFRALPAMGRWEAGSPGRVPLAASRITLGLFKKFVIADTLAQGMALNATNVSQVTNTPGLWLLLYGYALRLYFDFSGYTDIAIGLGLLFGIKLPENFNRPYLRSNITKFWQSWHITLSDWARFYVFSPLSRSLLRRQPRPSPTLIVLASQVATMVVIGLWHGVSWHFLLWGLWHGLALFAHKQWSDRTRKWYRGLKQKPRQMQAWTLFTWFLTLQYVVIGWVWFVVPDVGLAAQTVARLFGAGW